MPVWSNWPRQFISYSHALCQCDPTGTDKHCWHASAVALVKLKHFGIDCGQYVQWKQLQHKIAISCLMSCILYSANLIYSYVISNWMRQWDLLNLQSHLKVREHASTVCRAWPFPTDKSEFQLCFPISYQAWVERAERTTVHQRKSKKQLHMKSSLTVKPFMSRRNCLTNWLITKRSRLYQASLTQTRNWCQA